MSQHKTPSEAELVNTLSHLQLSPNTPSKTLAAPKSAPVAESWDADLSSGSDTETEANPSTSSRSTSASTASSSSNGNGKTPLFPVDTFTSNTSELPNPPPPTPASPPPAPFEFPDNVVSMYGQTLGGSRGESTLGGQGGREAKEAPTKRPEKTTAVAGRLIAGALGVRAPRRTAEEREYDRVVREKEKRRRDEQRERERREGEEREARKRAVWDD